MGKIADYFEQCRHDEEERERNRTVLTFARELNKSSEALMIQLHDAGVKKVSETDQITIADEQALLRYMQKKHGGKARRKKVTVTLKRESEEQLLIKAVAAQQNGAEWECLQKFTGDLISGSKIDPAFQAVINLIVAKSFVLQALPLKKLGRPKNQETDALGRKIALEYWDSRDGGTSYSEAVQRLAERFHKDERHIMRMVEKHKKIVGLTLEDREERRQWAAIASEAFRFLETQPTNSYFSMVLEVLNPPAPPEFDDQDCVEYLDEQMVKISQSKNPTDIK